jgi:DNA-binding transcriptional ArsR family regulator
MMKKGVEIIRKPETAKLLVDPMRREMMRLLADRAMTESELAETLGLSDPAVGHHLGVLREAGLIRIARREAEAHGILQKFYEANALVYLVESAKMPLEIERYFMPASMERARGIVAALNSLSRNFTRISGGDLEKLAVGLSSAIIALGPKYSKPSKVDRETLVDMIYRDALRHLRARSKNLPESVRQLLLETVH